MKFQIDFMGVRALAVSVSALFILVSVFAIGLWGLQFGLEFTGGTLIELRFEEPVSPEQARTVLANAGLDRAVVQNLGSDRDLMIRMPSAAGVTENQTAERVSQLISEHLPVSEIRRVEFVGPVVGEELRDAGGLAMLAAFAGITVYILFRFAGKFAVAALITLVHDVIITVGAFAVMRWEVDLQTVAALLTVIGYSLNDTIVVFDRIRENMRKLRKINLIDCINLSLNQTLERTLIMTFTTMLVLVVMLLFGGDQLRGFSSALTIGVVVGTYSSIYVAAAYLVLVKLSAEDLFVAVDEAKARGEPVER